MSDINVIKYSQFIPVTNLGLESQFTLFIEAPDIQRVETVFINGTSTKEFVVLSTNKLIVDIPIALRNSPIKTVSLAGVSGEVGFLTFNIKSNDPITDSRYVVQRFFRYLLMDRGTDIFNPVEGLGLLSGLTNVKFDDVEVYVVSAIQEAEQHVIRTQRPQLPTSKTLRMVQIENVSYSTNTLTASVELGFTLADGSKVNTQFNLAS